MRKASLASLSALWSAVTAAQGFQSSKIENNPDFGFSATAVRLFLNNLKPPVVRISFTGPTWIEFPLKVTYCQALASYVEVERLKITDDAGAQRDSLYVVSAQSFRDKLPAESEQRLLAGKPLPPVSVNCLIGNNKKAVFFLMISADSSFLVDFKVPHRVTLKDLQGGIKPEIPNAKPETTMVRAGVPIEYDLTYYREVPVMKPSELFQTLKKLGAI